MTRRKTDEKPVVAPARSDSVNRLIRIMKEDIGVPNVYYEPPPGTKMRYPCVRFQRNRFDTFRADNLVYKLNESFQVILIYSEPDSPFPAMIAMLPLCRHDRHYTADNLSHDVYTIYI